MPNATREYAWRIEPTDGMHVPVVIHASREWADRMDPRALRQATEVARLPGIVQACYLMPDAHWGFGFPGGTVAAFDPESDGIIAVGGVGVHIGSGVRALHAGVDADRVMSLRERIADALHAWIPPSGEGRAKVRLSTDQMDGMLTGGARWAVGHGWGEAADLERTEARGRVMGADPVAVSQRARIRERHSIGTLGPDEQYLEVQRIGQIRDPERARAFGLAEGRTLCAIHGGSHGLGHQITMDYFEQMAAAIPEDARPNHDLVHAPIESDLGRRCYSALRAGMNGALANRQILTHLARHAFAESLPQAALTVFHDFSYNTCRPETHLIDGRERSLYVHRKGAVPVPRLDSPTAPRTSAPVIVGGVMGAESWVMAVTEKSDSLAFGSIPSGGSGHLLGRHPTVRRWRGLETGARSPAQAIAIRGPSLHGLGEAAPGTSDAVRELVEIIEQAGFARRVARLEPLICIEG